MSRLSLPGQGSERSALAFDSGRLFVLTPFPHVLLALKEAANGPWTEAWRHVPSANLAAEGWRCCDREDHGPVIDGDAVYLTTLDGHVVALDKTSGKPLWQADVASPAEGYTLEGPALVEGGRVIVGATGDEAGRRGFVVALDQRSGKALWKRYTTGSDSDVGIGAGFHPVDPALRGPDLGRTTWPGDQWQSGGGGVAGPLIFDPDRGLVYHGTGHPAPWNAEPRNGLNRWTSGLFARDDATGQARWFIDFNPGNPYAFRDAGSNLVTRLPGPAGPRSVIVHPDANGWLYVIESDTGAVLAADPLVPSVVASVDASRGTTQYREGMLPRPGQQTRSICPSWMGTIGGSALDPARAQRVVVTLDRTCMDFEPRPANAVPGTPYVGANVRLRVPLEVGGQVVAWDIAARKMLWHVDERWPVLAAPLVTKGLVVYGTLDGRLEALDVDSGRRVATAKLPAGVLSTPLAFVDSQGRASVAVVVGTGRIRGVSRQESLDARDGSAGFGMAGWVGSWPKASDSHAVLMTLRLP